MDWQEIERRVGEKFACSCEETEIRYRVHSNATKHFHRQCLLCGEYGTSLKRAEVPINTQRLCLPVDEELREKSQAARREYGQHLRFEEKRGETAEWFARYNEYLASEAWKRRCRKVLERDGGMCQACLKRPATQVHHLTYEHVFNEPLFDLTSVCSVCHEFITALDRKRKGTEGLVPR
jgi:hypothetical protein